MTHRLKVKIDDRWYSVEIDDLSASPLQVLVDGEPVEVDSDLLKVVEPAGPAVAPASTPATAPAPTEESRPAQPTIDRAPAAVKVFRSPMPGIILSVAVKEGDQVVTGDEVCVLEAMKMQQTLRADWSGVVRAVHVQPGQQVQDGQTIVELE